MGKKKKKLIKLLIVCHSYTQSFQGHVNSSIFKDFKYLYNLTLAVEKDGTITALNTNTIFC